ncbi:hypothetical protein EJ06DRAFT_532844 [Trichodelitschia bisporula]|uniref:Uncharacterized protein n=1 Tax=Trichodelitschia bisporula TaxID=703511 RepID=A0A6G1HPA8_9PEZI|nr:hypothetical protein EJ06DRAFT_532844 [Trichodelitschia bisporula]
MNCRLPLTNSHTTIYYHLTSHYPITSSTLFRESPSTFLAGNSPSSTSISATARHLVKQSEAHLLYQTFKPPNERPLSATLIC